MYYSQKHYNLIRQLMRTSPSLSELQQLIKEALAQQPTEGSKQNAIEHMWGYFKKSATLQEKETFKLFIAEKRYDELLIFLYKLANQYHQTYLLNSTILNTKKLCD